MVKEPDMTNGKQLGDHVKKLVDNYKEREGIERIGAAIRANEQQVGGDHYKQMDIEPWDVIDTWPLDQQIGYHRGNALKYLMRMGSKDESPQEVAKGLHYLEKLLEVLKRG
jgi:hypothetical protein